MSRGDIASIFGDIFQLLDRGADGVSEYSINNDSISYWLKKNGNDFKKIYLPIIFIYWVQLIQAIKTLMLLTGI